MSKQINKKEVPKMTRFLPFIAIGLVMILTACGGDPKPTTVTILPDGNKMAYATTKFVVKAGQSVTIQMKNTATQEQMKHNVVILNDRSKIEEVGTEALKVPTYIPEHPAIIAATPMADAGQTTEVTFTAPTTPGKYVYICTFPGHYAMMQGDMIVVK